MTQKISDLQVSVGCVSNSKGKRCPLKRLELKLNFTSICLLWLLWSYFFLCLLSFLSTQVPFNFLELFSHIYFKNLVLIEESGSFQCLVCIFCHLPSEVALLLYVVHIYVYFGKFLLCFYAVNLFLSWFFLKMCYMFLMFCRQHLKFLLKLLNLIFKLWISRLNRFTQFGELCLL